MIRVLVADDEPLMTVGIRTVLESDRGIEVVAEAHDGRVAVDAALRHRVDVALLDIKMPGMDGLAALTELRRRVPTLRVVILTSFGAEPNIHRALAAGASGFVLKNCAPDELIRAVRAAHEGHAYLSPPVTRTVLGMIAPAETARRRASGRPHPCRSPDRDPPRRRARQRGHRPPPPHDRVQRQDLRQPHPHQARLRQPRPGRPAGP